MLSIALCFNKVFLYIICYDLNITYKKIIMQDFYSFLLLETKLIKVLIALLVLVKARKSFVIEPKN